MYPIKAYRGVTHRPNLAAGERLAQRLGDRMEAEDMPDLEDASRAPLRLRQGSPLGHREGERFLDDAVLAGAQALGGERTMTVGRGHQIHRVDLGQAGAEIRHDARGRDPRPDGEGAALLGRVGDPEVDA